MSGETEPLGVGLSCHPLQQRRKFSFPASLHSNLLGLGSPESPSAARRRFSNVSDAVSRKLSHTMGWRTAVLPTAEVVAEGRALVGQYIRGRLKRSGAWSRKCPLRGARARTGAVGEVLAAVGPELERLHPKLYSAVARQAGGSEKAAPGLTLTAVGRELFKADVTWGKVVSLFAVAGGLAVDCVRHGHTDDMHTLVEAVVELLEDELAPWIVTNGGWMGLVTHCRPPTSNALSTTGHLRILTAFLFSVIMLIFLPRLFSNAEKLTSV